MRHIPESSASVPACLNERDARSTLKFVQRFRFDGAFGRRAQEVTPIPFGGDTRVENDDSALIALRADESSGSLPEFDDGGGQRLFFERIAAGRLDLLEARFDQRLVGDRKRQADDDDVTQRFTAHIDTHPEAVDAKEHGRTVLLKTLQHGLRRQAGALYKQIETIHFNRLANRISHSAHQGCVGKQHKGLPAALR